MGNINKYSNLYNKDNELIKSVSDKGILTDYSIKELEELVDSLEDGNAKSNVMSMLQKMYTNPKTDADKEYVKKLQEELIKNMMANKANASTDKEEVTKSLGEVEDVLTEVIDEQKQEKDSNVIICHNTEAVEQFDKAVRDQVMNTSNVDDEYVEPISETPINEDLPDGMLNQIKREYKYTTHTGEETAKLFNKMDNDIRQTIIDRENNK